MEQSSGSTDKPVKMRRMSGPQPSELGCREKLYIQMDFEMMRENQSRCLDIYIDLANTTGVWGESTNSVGQWWETNRKHVNPRSLPLADGADVFSSMARIVSVLG